MSTPLLATKLYAPAPPTKIVQRPRLIEILKEGLAAGRKLTLISASAGFGKTTLVSAWLSTLPSPPLPPGEGPGVRGPGAKAAWLALDESDSDLTRFLTYFVVALQTLEPTLGNELLGMLQAPMPLPTETLLTSLINDITNTPTPLILVLDDYHLLDSPAVDEALVFLLEHLPPHLHLALTTREDPPLPLPRLRARRQLTELRAADLRFTSEEAAEFLNQIMGLHLSASDLATLEARTEGWIAGLQLAALSMQGHRDTHSFIQSFAGTHRFILDYLLEEVLQKQPAPLQNFLLRTAILNRLCAPLCAALLQADANASQKILEGLERSNLFIIALDGERRWFRYHHLFGDLLRQRAGQTLPAAERARDHLRASHWHEKLGEISEAFQHAIAAEDFNRAAALAEIAWQSMDESLRPAVWLAWTRQLPENVIRARPVLCTQIAWSFTDSGQVEASEARLQDAERSLSGAAEAMIVVEQTQFRVLPARIAFARAYNRLVMGHAADAVTYAEKALEITPEDEPFLQAQIKTILGTAYWSSGQLDAAAQAMRAWIAATQKSGNTIFAIASGFGLGDILVAQGHLREAQKAIQQSLQFAAGHEAARGVIANHYIGLAMIAHEQGEDEAATAYFEEGVTLATQSTLVDTPYRLLLAQARFKEFDGDLDAARKHLEEAQHVYVENPIPNARPVEALLARLHLKQGELARAQDWARKLSGDGDAAYLHEFVYLTLARVWLAEYQDSRNKRLVEDTLRLLTRILDAAERDHRTASVIEILIGLALAHEARGDTPAARGVFVRALALAAPEGYVRLFVGEGTVMARLLYEVLAEGVEAQYVRRLLRAFPTSRPEKTIAASDPAKIQEKGSLLEPLSARELEVLGGIAEGLSNQAIADKLYLSLHTVKIHARNIYAKLGVSSHTQAVARGKALGILTR